MKKKIVIQNMKHLANAVQKVIDYICLFSKCKLIIFMSIFGINVVNIPKKIKVG